MENTPEDIFPKDDAFHGSIKRLSAEWWYFDAIFENGYAIHIGCMTYTKKKRGNLTQVLDIYKDGKIIVGEKRKEKFKNCYASKEKPLVKFLDKDFINFDEEKFSKTGKWSYNIKLRIKDQEINLNFIGTTKGWKIETDRESWGVAIPKAIVSGEITIDGKKEKVKGIGYHDHNWNYNLKTLLTYGKGWYWGRIMSENYNLIFANIIKSKSSVLLSVINKDDNKYWNINPKNINFKYSKFLKNNRRKIPSEFSIKIDSNENNFPIKVNVKMETQQIHYERRLLFMSYFRFHEKSIGFISVNNKKEKVKETQIMELLKFR